MAVIKEFAAGGPAAIRSEVLATYQPAVLRGLVRDWPAVRAAARSAEEATDYLATLDVGAPVDAFFGPPDIDGRYFYRPDLSGFNFERKKGAFAEVLPFILRVSKAERQPCVYVGAAPVPECMPGFTEQNPMPLLEGYGAVPRLWVGNRSVVSAHFDLSDNIACVVAGRRRFTLFPPDQAANLYVGPLDHNMAGQPASLVDLRAPDLERFPRFREALEHAATVELEPGDAIYIPTLWWHHVEALSAFNILINYWWDDRPTGAGSPFEAMVHGIHGVAHLPEERRQAWRALFDHYVFRTGGDPAAHLPPERQGILAPPSPPLGQRIRQFLMRGLSRP